MNIPAKIQKVLDEATARGLEVKFTPDDRPSAYSTVHSWTVSSPLSYDLDAVFIYWTPGSNGGRVRYLRYTPQAAGRRRTTAKLTRTGARSWIAMLGDALARSRG